MTIYQAMRGQPVDLGRQGEHRARRVVFDISDWVRDFGAGTVRLLHQRQDDAAPYPVSVTRTDNDGVTVNDESGTLILWDVTDADTATRQRYGRAELRYYSVGDGGESFLAKSETYQTFVADALGAEVQEAPEGQRGWIDELLDAADTISENVAAARTAESNAADDANTAHAAAIAAQAAQSGAEEARDAIENMTVSASSLAADASATVTKSETASGAVSLLFGIPRGAKGDKGDTGETGPQGAQGPVGPQGPQGVQGPQGAKGDKGDKGDTGEQGPQGEQGPKGDKGDKGDTGDGVSAADLQRITDNETAVAAILAYLRTMEIYRTASGNPVAFDDGCAAALKSCVVTITPTQSGTPSVETPVPIPGYDSLTITRTGRNLAQMYLGNVTSHGISYSLNNGALHCEGENTDRTSSFSGGNYSSYAACPWKFPAGTYTLTVSGLADNDRNVSGVSVMAYPKSADSYVIVAENMINGSIAFTADEPFGAWFWLYVRPGKSVNQDLYIQIERGTQASPYETYRGQSVSVPLSSGTVYGGTLDVISGTLTVTHGNIASYNGETVPDGWISSTGQLSTGAQVVYPLASPLSYSLTPVSLAALSGYNCVYADAGTLAVSYRADPQISFP